ncbi:hypothetical protein Dsin_008582 [Dipteronia sinensis]|uniref:RNase H type-1 domain-containing protein n=1 Tax=Dipteronia sinensis TaxID=43782 RepID=A0AAE0EBA5_9ROSI|nr:hypothetical protein Dsin_008582 [Dipteronia sinensis]
MGGHIGIGVFSLDLNGEVLASCSQVIEAYLSTKDAKLTAIVKSIQFVLDCGLEPCMFEVDEATVVKWIIEGSHSSSKNGVLLNDICSLSTKLRLVKFGHVPKKANSVARGLARRALEITRDAYWMEEFPGCVKDLVEADMPR